MDKSADAFRTISEVAGDLALPQHVLRFWESRFSQIKPLKRAGRRRYYRPADIVLLRSIRRLLYDEGYTIKGVQRLLKDRGAKNLELQAPVAAHPGADALTDAIPAGDSWAGDSAEAAGSAIEVAPLAFRSVLSASQEDFGDYASLSEALACIEECERILAAVRSPLF